jgi:formaldehyde-activating enzyme involved in methanogenesis
LVQKAFKFENIVGWTHVRMIDLTLGMATEVFFTIFKASDKSLRQTIVFYINNRLRNIIVKPVIVIVYTASLHKTTKNKIT